MSSLDAAAIGAAITQALIDKEQREQAAREAAQQATIADAATEFVERISHPMVTTNDPSEMLNVAKDFITKADADSSTEFSDAHLRMFLEVKFPAASAAEIEAVIVAAEGS